MPPTLLHALHAHAAAQPHAPAFTFLRDGDEDAVTWTFAELRARVDAVAAAIAAVAAPGQRVLLLHPQGLDYVAALLACMQAGVLAVPLQPPGKHRAKVAAARLDTIVADGGLALVTTVTALQPHLQGLTEGSAAFAGIPWIATDTIAVPTAATPPALPADPDALAYLQYTSGSTSTPKGVMVSHTNLAVNLATFDVDFGHGPDTVVVSWLPTFHDLGLVYGVFLPLWKGVRGVLIDPLHFLQRPARWVQAIHRFRGTHAPAPNFAFALVAERTSPAERDALDLSCWKVALNGAEPIRHESEAAFVEAFEACGVSWRTLKHAYGMSESTAVISKEPIDSEPVFLDVDAAALERHVVRPVPPGTPGLRRIAGCGACVAPTFVRIVDPDTLRACPPDGVGEIWVGGPTRAQGYWRRPEDSEAGFRAVIADTGEGDLLRTGDLGFVHGGQVFVTGRHKDLLIVRGENHYPQDVELAAERAHPAVRPSCVAAFSIEHNGLEGVGLAAEVLPERLDDPDAVIAALREAVASEGLHARLIALLPPRGVPKTSSGKIMRRRTREGLADGSIDTLARWEAPLAAPPEAPAPAAGLPGRLAALPEAARPEALIAHILGLAAQMLGFDDPAALDPDTALRDLGLDSVQAVDLGEQLARDLGRALSATVIFDHPSARALATWLLAEAAPALASAAPDDGLDDLDEAALAALLAKELGELG